MITHTVEVNSYKGIFFEASWENGTRQRFPKSSDVVKAIKRYDRAEQKRQHDSVTTVINWMVRP